MTDGDFARLLAGFQAGDDGAMRTLFREFHPRIVRFIGAAEPGAAEDLASEVWMAVARGLREFRGGAGEFRVWMFSIARRRISEHRRRGMRRPSDPYEDDHFNRLPGHEDPESTAVGRISGVAAAALVTATLSPDQADVVLLRVLADLDVSEVAEVMGQTANWVRVTQHRALRHLADRLGSRIEVIQ